MTPTIFTPNVVKGNPGQRYRLERDQDAPNYFRVPGESRWYRMAIEPDDCGLGCRCAAFMQPETMAGRLALERAEKF